MELLSVEEFRAYLFGVAVGAFTVGLIWALAAICWPYG